MARICVFHDSDVFLFFLYGQLDSFGRLEKSNRDPRKSESRWWPYLILGPFDDPPMLCPWCHLGIWGARAHGVGLHPLEPTA